MKRVLRNLAIMTAVAGVPSSTPLFAQFVPAAPRAKHVEITQGPRTERADDYLTIITWTSNNPGGDPDHMGIVHYGTDPRNLNQTAKSPIRLNQGHPTTIFRVRVQGLKANTTYYYTVDSADAGSGKSDGVKSPIGQFTPHKLTMPTAR